MTLNGALTLLNRDKRRRCKPEMLPATSESTLPVPHNPKRSRCSLIVVVAFEQLLLFKFVVRQQWCCCSVAEPLQFSVAVPFDSAYSTVPDVFMCSQFGCLAD